MIELWRPTIDSMGGASAYPLFDQLASQDAVGVRSRNGLGTRNAPAAGAGA